MTQKGEMNEFQIMILQIKLARVQARCGMSWHGHQLLGPTLHIELPSCFLQMRSASVTQFANR
jgi:hypothetical protein